MTNNVAAIKPVELEDEDLTPEEIEEQFIKAQASKPNSMPTKFEERANGCYFQTNTPLLEQLELLPPSTYTIGITPMGEMFLQQIEDYSLGKIYGNVEKQAERIKNTFKSRPSGTGLMLSGEKGSGKTTLAKLLSIELMKEGLPTIVINRPLCGEGFNKFIQNIKQPAVIVFDEFEKVYHEKQHQEAMLTLLDGVYPTKKLFILTTNDRYGINQHMINRPGRLFYHLQYKGLEEQFVIDYCKDNLNNQANLQGVVNLIELFEHFNFDMLKAVVEEMNRYGETAKEAMVMMNIKSESWSQKFEVAVYDAAGNKLELYEAERRSTAFINPEDGHSVYFYPNGTPKMPKDKEQHTKEYLEAYRVRENSRTCIEFEEEHLTSIKRGVYTYEHAGYKLVLTKAKTSYVSYETMMM